MTKITIGARGSKLSSAYVSKVKDLLLRNNKELQESDINLKIIKTSGDVHQNIKLSEIGGKNLFCKEIEEALLAGDIDVAVHSLKDMETIENSKLIVGAYIKRNDYRDVIISNKIKNIEELKKGVIIGSSSKRRELQLKNISKKITVVNIRGNVDTRIKKIEEKKLDGIILAAAGVKSLNLNSKVSLTFEINQILPAVGQGIIAVQCKEGDLVIKNLLQKIDDQESNFCAKAEKKMLQVIGGDCETAVGGLALINNKKLTLKAQLFSDKGDQNFDCELSGNFEDAVIIGEEVGKKLLSLAGKNFKKK